jgi:hypothetical protein
LSCGARGRWGGQVDRAGCRQRHSPQAGRSVHETEGGVAKHAWATRPVLVLRERNPRSPHLCSRCSAPTSAPNPRRPPT